MLESGAFAGTPQLDYETWRALVRSEYGDENVSEPNVFAAWRRPLSVCGFIAAATRIECGVMLTRSGGRKGMSAALDELS